ncbi:hypothetical protein MRB53_041336 [Persea americana]|nr:hypothetical protein MRB53_041336 [Persea americana]
MRSPSLVTVFTSFISTFYVDVFLLLLIHFATTCLFDFLRQISFTSREKPLPPSFMACVNVYRSGDPSTGPSLFGFLEITSSLCRCERGPLQRTKYMNLASNANPINIRDACLFVFALLSQESSPCSHGAASRPQSFHKYAKSVPQSRFVRT